MFCRFWFIFVYFGLSVAFPEAGRFFLNVNSSRQFNGIVKNVYNGTKIYIKVRCDSKSDFENQVKIGWILRETICWNEYLVLESGLFETYYHRPASGFYLQSDFINKTNYVKVDETMHACDSVINLPPYNGKQVRNPDFRSIIDFVSFC